MANPFFEHPILNSPYDCPQRHWELDADGQPTQRIVETRRRAEFITPIPKPKKRKKSKQQELVFDEGAGLSTQEQQYDPTSIINEVRSHVDQWRAWPNPSEWQVSPETARLLQHWRHHSFSGVRPFFCQVEAVETAIWLTEVAPNSKVGKRLLEHLAAANKEANPELLRLALKLATGAGKTTVMAMLIAWQAINAVRRPSAKSFTRGFLVVTPGLTIKDRLRVLQPNDPDSYYASRELVPGDMLDDVNRAKIVITNYHAFKLRERTDISKGTRAAIEGWRGEELKTLETEGQMLQRVMPDLMGMKNIFVLNDEAHHCYREKPNEPDDDDLKGDEKKEAEKNNEAARLWISGLEADPEWARKELALFTAGYVGEEIIFGKHEPRHILGHPDSDYPMMLQCALVCGDNQTDCDIVSAFRDPNGEFQFPRHLWRDNVSIDWTPYEMLIHTVEEEVRADLKKHERIISPLAGWLVQRTVATGNEFISELERLMDTSC